MERVWRVPCISSCVQFDPDRRASLRNTFLGAQRSTVVHCSKYNPDVDIFAGTLAA